VEVGEGRFGRRAWSVGEEDESLSRLFYRA